MKRILIMSCLWSGFLFAQSSETITFDGTLSNQDGTAFEGTAELTFRAYRTIDSQDVIWTETHTGVKVKNGAYSVTLGNATALSLSLLKNCSFIEVESDGGTQPRKKICGPLMGRFGTKLFQFSGTLMDKDSTAFEGTTDLTFSVFRTPRSDSVLWSETHNAVEITDGEYTVLLGGKVPLSLSFLEYYLEIESSAVGKQRRIQITGPGYSFRLSFLMMAYGIVWIAIFLYLLSITRRQKRLIAELEALSHQ